MKKEQRISIVIVLGLLVGGLIGTFLFSCSTGTPTMKGTEATCPQAIGRVANEFAASLGLNDGQCVDAHNNPISEGCCMGPWQSAAQRDECENVGYNAVEDYCYDGGVGGSTAKRIDNICCSRMRQAVNMTRMRDPHPGVQ